MIINLAMDNYHGRDWANPREADEDVGETEADSTGPTETGPTGTETWVDPDPHYKRVTVEDEGDDCCAGKSISTMNK